MWCALSNIFTKNCASPLRSSEGDMDKSRDLEAVDSYDTRQAKQRASVKWLLSKAFNNKVPENLKEPFYKDHENQEHLKPQIVGALASAEMYCLALGNIYSDPNYHNLNHWSILQTLARKGVYISEPSDAQLTETTLIQTNPLKMSAHMAVIESMMTLYAKEVLTADRVLAAVQRFNHGRNPPPASPENHEQSIIVWVSHACEALKKRVEQELGEESQVNGGEGDRLKPPSFPPVRDLKDLCDGVALAALISYYCPEELPWTDLRVSYLPTVSDSLYNLGLVNDFCQRCLPASVFHMMPEDVTYMRGSMKQNLVVFLADLFNVMEIHPIKCVRYPGMEKTLHESFPARNAHGVVHKRNLQQSVVSPIPDLRSSLDDPATPAAFQVSRTTTTSTTSHVQLRKANSFQQSTSEMSEDSLRRGSDESFVVHRGRNIPTLSSVIHNEPPKDDGKAAGKPSNWNEKKTSYSGRRSRRNSVSDDSQLTIENFGGSQDNLNFIGRNPDKEVGAHIGRKLSTPPVPIENPAVRSTKQDARGSLQLGYDNGCDKQDYERKLSTPPMQPIENPAVRSSKQDARGSIQMGYDNGCEKQDYERENPLKMKRQMSNDEISLRSMHNKENLVTDLVDGEVSNRMSFADLNKQRQLSNNEQGGIQLVYMQNDNNTPSKSSFKPNNNTTQNGEKKTTTFATLPNTTTWQQQSSMNTNSNQHNDNNGDESGSSGGIMPSQLSDIRLKLEEKRRHIESEKRRFEAAMNKHRQSVGKAAFLQAVVKGKGSTAKTPDPESTSERTVEPSTKPQRPLSLQDISDDASNVERKWLDKDQQPFVETRRTPDIENMDMEQYQQQIAQMNNSLHDIQSDIQRLASQQNQFHHQQPFAPQQHVHPYQAQQHYQQMPHPQYTTQQSYNPPQYQQPGAMYNHPLQSSASAPHLPQSLYRPNSPRMSAEPQFFLHEQHTQSPPQPIVQRRTWAQTAPSQQQQTLGNDNYQQSQQQQQPEMRTWGKPQNPTGFMLHNNTDRYHESSPRYNDGRFQEAPRYQNGGEHSLNHSSSHTGFTLSQQHAQQQHQQQSLFAGSHGSPSTSPQHRNIHRQISQLMDDGKRNPVSLQQIDHREPPQRKSSVTHAPIPAPPADDMEPQNISFIGNPDDQQLTEGLSRLNITSGTRTYRIPSPTRPLITRNPFHPQSSPPTEREVPIAEVSSLDNDPTNQKGFYISFDSEQPKRPKPPLRTKRASPKKERSYVEDDSSYQQNQAQALSEKQMRLKELERELEEARIKKEVEIKRERELIAREQQERRETSQERDMVANASALVIGHDLNNPDPDLQDEREKKKEKIMLMSLQRRQQQEEAKARKEAEAQARREREKMKEEERARKKEEQAARRAQILEQYKLKKAIEEAEREELSQWSTIVRSKSGKDIDRSMLNSLKPAPKLRPKASTGRPRPKTIHIDSGSVEMAAEGMITPSRGKKGSTSNLTATSYTPSSTMRRDYYRGSQDNLSASSSMLYKGKPKSFSRSMICVYKPLHKNQSKDSPDDSRGMSPCHSANQTLARRSSYKTSRDPSPAQVRGRPKYSTYQNFKGRKSNSMMNLYGSSTDQDSLAYRYGDTDSGLGRATPPRRAPSPGMGPMRHLPSPSGPGSLPGLMSKRRNFDDGSSDISSTPSSMLDYTGPRLYKQPATKSNRGIMLNAVEYCVFPGAVNKEAKRRVLEEIARSESKHFLILFRDAGCQFRALYSYCPDGEEVIKLYGTGPKQVNDRMFDKFFKYNSGGKCFSQVHTKHLTVTIDAFTIHNSLWQGKKVNLPNKKDMALVI